MNQIFFAYATKTDYANRYTSGEILLNTIVERALWAFPAMAAVGCIVTASVVALWGIGSELPMRRQVGILILFSWVTFFYSAYFNDQLGYIAKTIWVAAWVIAAGLGIVGVRKHKSKGLVAFLIFFALTPLCLALREVLAVILPPG